MYRSIDNAPKEGRCLKQFVQNQQQLIKEITTNACQILLDAAAGQVGFPTKNRSALRG